MFIQPMEAEFGWSDRTISIAIGIQIALFGPDRAVRRRRDGALRRAPDGRLGRCACSPAPRSASPSCTPRGKLPIWGAAVGIGAGSIALMFGTTIATRWFDARRGVVLGCSRPRTPPARWSSCRCSGKSSPRVGWRPWRVHSRRRSPWTLIPLNLFVVRRAPERSRPAARFGATEVDATLPPRVNPIARAVRDAARSDALTHVLGSCGDVLHLRREHERLDRWRTRSRLRRSRHP